MQEFLPVLSKCILFDGISQEEMAGLLVCLEAKVQEHKKGSIIWAEGDPALYIGIVLEGAVQIVKDDFYGNRSIVSHIGVAELFGESFAASGTDTLPVSITAARDCRIMVIECSHITVGCSNACGFHSQMIHNLLRVVANKNIQYNQKLEITAQRTTREKLMTYLMMQAKQHGSNAFTIPYDRQGLADFLGVERSAMSAEISKLRSDGKILCDRSHFTLL